MSNDKLEEAKAALEAGNIPESDKLFAVAENGELTRKQFAEVALARGGIAESELRWKDAAEHYARAVQLDRRFETLITAQRLAFDMGDYDLALSLGNEAKEVAIAEEDGKGNKYTISLNNLGSVYRKCGDFKEAELLYEEAIDIQRKISKGEERDTALSANLGNLAELYKTQGHYGKAKPLYVEALKIDETVFGEDHPETAASISNLGVVYEYLGEHANAESHYLKALDIRERLLLENHPAIANSLNNLAVFYGRVGKKRDDADLYYKRALKILTDSFGLEHPDTQLVNDNYERFLNKNIQVANSASAPAH